MIRWNAKEKAAVKKVVESEEMISINYSIAAEQPDGIMEELSERIED